MVTLVKTTPLPQTTFQSLVQQKMSQITGRSFLEPVSPLEVSLREWLNTTIARPEDALDYILHLQAHHLSLPWEQGYVDKLLPFIYILHSKEATSDDTGSP